MIDEILKKYGIVDNKFYRVAILYQVLTDLGIINMQRKSFTSVWFRRRIEAGSIILPKKHDNSSYWFISGKQLEGIVRAFIPEGKGYYNYQEDKQ